MIPGIRHRALEVYYYYYYSVCWTMNMWVERGGWASLIGSCGILCHLWWAEIGVHRFSLDLRLMHSQSSSATGWMMFAPPLLVQLSLNTRYPWPSTWWIYPTVHLRCRTTDSRLSFEGVRLGSIRRSLIIESSHALVRALVLTRLDYCNGLLGGAPKCLLGQLSGVLRAAACLILLLPRSGSVTDRIRTELHWLDIPSRVTFKLCVLAYPRVCSILSCPFLHAGQCNSRTLTTAICGGRCVICAEVTHFDNWSAGFCHFLPLCLEQPPGWSSWSRP